MPFKSIFKVFLSTNFIHDITFFRIPITKTGRDDMNLSIYEMKGIPVEAIYGKLLLEVDKKINKVEERYGRRSLLN